MKNTSVVEADNYEEGLILGFEDYCIIDKEDYEVEPETIHQFYFVKFNRNFIDPALKAKIERLEILNDCIDRQKNSILHEIESLKKQIVKFDKEEKLRYHYEWNMEYYNRKMAEHWPECVDEDPEEAMDPKIEEVKIEETITNLTYQLGHGNYKVVEQKRLLRELKHMEDKRKELELQVKQGEVHIPPGNRECSPTTLSKYNVQSSMRRILEEKRVYEEAQEQKKEERWKKKIREAEKRLSFINQKQTRVCNRILTAQNKLHQQVSCYEGFLALKKKIKELAIEKDLVALEQLSTLQVEGFMQRCTREHEFKANYERSLCFET